MTMLVLLLGFLMRMRCMLMWRGAHPPPELILFPLWLDAVFTSVPPFLNSRASVGASDPGLYLSDQYGKYLLHLYVHTLL